MKSHTLEATKNPDLFRVVDRDGNWQYYFHQPSGRYLVGITTVLQRGYAKGVGFEEWLLRITPAERDEILRITGEKGDRIHKWIDSALSFNEMDTTQESVTSKWSKEEGIYNRRTQDYEQASNEEWDAILAFSRFWERHEPVVLSSEDPVYNLSNGYAGTPDAFLILTKACDVKTCQCASLVGKTGVWDWKTGSGIRPSYSAQLGAIANGDNVFHLTGGRMVEYGAILRIGTNHKTTGGYEMESFATFRESATESKEDRDKQYRESLNYGYDRFCAAKLISEYEYKPFNPEKEIVDIPDAITLTVKHKVPDEMIAQPALILTETPADVVPLEKTKKTKVKKAAKKKV